MMSADGRSLQERLEASDAGRALLSVFLGVTLLGLVVLQLPPSHLRAQTMQILGPYSYAIGLDQSWGVFAPDPRRISIAPEARVTLSDGSVRVWRMPRANDVVGPYWDFRWRKYMERLTSDRRPELRAPFALWAARHEADDERAVRVELVRRWFRLEPPGFAPPLRGPWQEYRFFTLPEEFLRAAGSS